MQPSDHASTLHTVHNRPEPNDPTSTFHGSSSQHFPLSPRQFGDYEILEELGRGGMGIVYRARQVKADRLVALKLIAAGVDPSGEMIARFKQEARLAARIEHPNIVPIYEVGEIDGQPFYSMALVEGGSLSGLLGGIPLQPTEAARIVQQIALGVQAAHDHGIVHRDLKPGNVLLQIADRKTQVEGPVADSAQSAICNLQSAIPKITDFGLARRTSDPRQTQSGAILGTPAYMAPEQAAGNVHEVGPASDVYALGAILYECLTGRPPFQAAGAMETLLQVLEWEPVPPRQLNPAVPRDLETVCLKCLEKPAARRYNSARELGDELARFGRGEPVHGRPVGRLERGWRWCRRNPVVASLLAAVVLLLLGGATTATVLAILAERNADIADANAVKSADNAEKATKKAADERQARKDEEKARQDEKRERERAEQLLYANRLDLALRYWDEGNVIAAMEQLDGVTELRNEWECRLVRMLMTRQGQSTLRGHTSSVFHVSYSADGSQLFSASGDGGMRFWNLATGRERLLMKMSEPGLTAVSFSSDGQQVATVMHRKWVRIWEVGTNRLVSEVPVSLEQVYAVVFSPNNQYLAVAAGLKSVTDGSSRVGELTLFDVKTNQVAYVRKTDFPVQALAFNTSGTQLISGYGDGKLVIWEVDLGLVKRELTGLKEAVTTVCVSPDGRRVAAAAERTSAVHVWDLTSGQELQLLQTRSPVHHLAFSPDGRRLAGDLEGGKILVWDTATNRELFRLQSRRGSGFSICFSPDSRWLASACGDEIRIWDAEAGQEPTLLRGHLGEATAVAFSPTGRHIASASDDGWVKVWDLTGGKKPITCEGHQPGADITCLCFSADGQRVASVSLDGTARLWESTSGREVGQWKVGWAARGVALSSDGRRLAVPVNENARIWDTNAEAEPVEFATSQPLQVVALAPDGKMLASLDQSGVIRLWDIATRKERQNTLRSRGANTYYNIQFSPDGRRLAAAGANVDVWDLASGEIVLTLRGDAGNLMSRVAFSPDGRRLVTMGQSIKIWDAESGRALVTLRQPAGVNDLSLSADGKKLAVARKDGAIQILDSVPEPEPLTLRHGANTVSAASFSPDGQLAATASAGKVHLWNAHSGKHLNVLDGHAPNQSIVDVRFSPDGSLLASACSEGVIKLWDLSTHKETLALRPGQVSSVCFSGDGLRLIAVDYHRQLRTVWELKSGKVLADHPEPYVHGSRHNYDWTLFLQIDGTNVNVCRLTPDASQLADWRRRVEPDLAWHGARAEQAESKGDGFAAAFHWGRLLRARPGDPALHIRRAGTLLRSAAADQARAHLALIALTHPRGRIWPRATQPSWPARMLDIVAVQHESGLGDLWEAMLLGQQAAGQEDSARRMGQEMIRRFGDDPAGWLVLGSICVGVPCDPAAAAEVLRTARIVAAGAPENQAAALLLGMALYRAGRYDEAKDALTRLVDVNGHAAARTHLFLAMTYHRRGERKQAQEELDRFEKWFRTTPPDDAFEEVRLRLLHEEAVRLTREMPRAPD